MTRPQGFLALLVLALLSAVAWVALSGRSRESRTAHAASSVRAPTSSAETELAELAELDGGADFARASFATQAGSDAAADSSHGAASGASAPEGFEEDAVYGTLRDKESEAPVAGARVLVFAEAERARDHEVEAADVTGDARTDEHGRFRFRELEPLHEYAVYVEAPGYVPLLMTNLSGREHAFELEPAAWLAGRVLDAGRGTPLAGMEVALDGWHWSDGRFEERARAVSDGDGRFRLERARVDSTAKLYVLAADTQPVMASFRVVSGGRDDCDIRVQRGSTLRGKVHAAADGRPLAGVELRSRGRRAATSDDAGRFAVSLASLEGESESEGMVELTTHLAGYCDTRMIASAAVLATVPELRLPLVRAAALLGTVRSSDGSAIAGAQVILSSSWPDPPPLESPAEVVRLRLEASSAKRTAETDAEGRYRLDAILPGTQPKFASARHPEHERSPAEQVLLPAPGTERTLDFVLAPGALVTGRVLLEGVPVPALVWLRLGNETETRRSNDAGRFRFVGVPAGEAEIGARLSSSQGGGTSTPGEALRIVAGAEVVHDVELAGSTVMLSGTVRSAAGEALGDVQVAARVQREPRAPDSRWNLQASEVKESTAPDWSFALRMAGSPSDVFLVRARKGAVSAERSGVPANATDVDLVLPEATTLRLAVRDELARKSLGSYEVYWRAPGRDQWARTQPEGGTLPDPEGCVALELPLGPVELAVSARSQGFISAERALHLTQQPEPEIVSIGLVRGTNVTLDFEIVPSPEASQTRTAHAFFLLGAGQALPDESADGFHDVELRRFQSVTPNRGGRGRAFGLAPGHYRLVSHPPGFTFEPAELEVPALDQVRFSVRASGAPGAIVGRMVGMGLGYGGD